MGEMFPHYAPTLELYKNLVMELSDIHIWAVGYLDHQEVP